MNKDIYFYGRYMQSRGLTYTNSGTDKILASVIVGNEKGQTINLTNLTMKDFKTAITNKQGATTNINNVILTNNDTDINNNNTSNKKNDTKIIKETCLMPYTDMFIFPDGKMGICCCDNFEVTNLADLNEVPLKEAWNSDEYKKAREAIKDGRQNFPFCKFCDFIDAGLRMDAVNDVLAGREANHGARQSLMKHKK